jgi:hypothetical protein
MSNRIEADEAKAKSNRHREATVTAPVLDSTRRIVSDPDLDGFFAASCTPAFSFPPPRT